MLPHLETIVLSNQRPEMSAHKTVTAMEKVHVRMECVWLLTPSSELIAQVVRS